MSKPIAWVMCDLDGTLLDSNKKLSDTTYQTLRSLKQKGIYFGVATGRPLASLLNKLEEMRLDTLCDGIVANNGVEIYDSASKLTKVFSPLNKQRVIDIYRPIRARGYNYCLYDQGLLYARFLDEHVERIARNNGVQIHLCEIEDVQEDCFNKLMIIVQDADMKFLKEFSLRNLPKDVRGFQSQWNMFEFVDVNASKASGIQRLISVYGHDLTQVMAFGDQSNDIEMLAEVGIGVCMANGSDDAKKASNRMTKSNDEDGVAYFLNSYFDLK